MIIIEHSKTLTQPYKVRYTGKNNETLATSELLKNKKACWRNIYAIAKCFNDCLEYETQSEMDTIAVKDTTVPNPEVFVYDINGIKKKAGVRK